MKTGAEDLFLEDGSKIAVIGAGPVGAFFADFAMHRARERGLNLSITLFDGKDFTQSGPKGCNLCAGVISETLIDRMCSIGIVLPEEKIQRKIEGYYLRLKTGEFLMKHPLSEKQITTVFRGNGPRLSSQGKNVSFDDYLLKHVRQKGLKVFNRPVKQIQLPLNPREPVRVIYGIGKRDMKKEDLLEFLNLFIVHKKLPDNWRWSDSLCRCYPKVAVTSAKKPFTHRLVIIGDASCSRYYKNGIESAFVTAQIAADTAINYGVSESAFKKGYFRCVKKIIARDNFYGRVLFKINDLVSGSAFLSKVMLNVAANEVEHGKNMHMRSVLWNMYTGNIPYRTILLKFLNPVLQWKLTIGTIKRLYSSFFIKAEPLHHDFS